MGSLLNQVNYLMPQFPFKFVCQVFYFIFQTEDRIQQETLTHPLKIPNINALPCVKGSKGKSCVKKKKNIMKSMLSHSTWNKMHALKKKHLAVSI